MSVNNGGKFDHDVLNLAGEQDGSGGFYERLHDHHHQQDFFSEHSIGSRSPQTVTTAPATTDTSSAPTPTRTVLKCFEVDQPVLSPDGPAEADGSSFAGSYEGESCTVHLMRRDFAWSYEDPFIGELARLSAHLP
jgi:hypothetical protein